MVPASRTIKWFGLLIITVAAVVILIPINAKAATQSLSVTASADAYVNQTYPTSNYGSKTANRIDGSPIYRAYLRFSVSGINPNPVNQATLKVYANSSLSAGFTVNALSDNTWTESTINYNNAPAAGGQIATSGTVNSGQWISIDITAYITGDGTYNLVLMPLSSTQLNLASRETGANAPQLVVSYTTSGTGATSTPTQASAPSATRTATRTVVSTSTSTSAPNATVTRTTVPNASATSTPAASATPTQAANPTATPTQVAYATATRTPAASATPTSIAPSSTPTPSPGSGQVPTFSHVFVLIFENKEYTSIIGKSNLPNFNSLASQYTLLTQSYAVRHPSLPNYIALTSGSTQGIASDCTSCFLNEINIADQIEASGRSWKAYMESMPSTCFIGNSGTYVQKHNPFVYYDNIRTDTARCRERVVPLTQLDADLNNSLPDFVWITPNECNNSHDCSSTVADQFLGSLVNKIISSPAFDQNSLLIVTFDEGSSSASCCGTTSGGHIATILISPLAKSGFQDTTPYNHYSILKTIEKSWGMSYLLYAGDSATSLITAPWK